MTIRAWVLNILALEPRLASLLAAISVYALFGAPTPDRLGLAEAVTGILLLLAAGGWRVITLFQLSAGSWQTPALALMVYGLSVPLVGAVIQGASLALVLRDIVAFAFLLLPLFFIRQSNSGFSVPVTVAVAAAGIFFALRALLPLWCQSGRPELYCLLAGNPQAYLANAPTVLFAALLCLGLAGKRLYKRAGRKDYAHSLFLVLLALIPLAAMALTLQRASLAFVALTLVALFTLGFIRRPGRMILPLFLAVIALWLGGSVLLDVYLGLRDKSSLVGLNMRWQEAAAVFQAISGSFWTTLFGLGWGAEFVSPAVGGLSVNFTHSLITTYLLKTGLCGVLLVISYLVALGIKLFAILAHHPVIAMAIAAPFMIDIFLYASFKSLDFGLLLFLIPLWADRARSLHIGQGYSTA